MMYKLKSSSDRLLDTDQSDPRQPQVSRPDQTPPPAAQQQRLIWIFIKVWKMNLKEIESARELIHSIQLVRSHCTICRYNVHLVGRNLCFNVFSRCDITISWYQYHDSYFQSLANERNLSIEISLMFHCSTWWWSDVVSKFRVTIEEEILRHIQSSNKVSLQSAPGSKLLLNGPS